MELYLIMKSICSLTQSGVPNFVYTGVIVNYCGKIKAFTEVTKVFMAFLNDEEINAYVDSGEPMYNNVKSKKCHEWSCFLCSRGKAGGYGIQGIASTFVQRIEGDYNNVIGLPLCRLAQTLKEIVNWSIAPADPIKYFLLLHDVFVSTKQT